MSPVLSDATQADLAAIRDLQIDSWRRAYRGLLSETFLDDEVERILAERWSALPGEGWTVIVARNGTRIDGFATIDRARGAGAYIDNLHVAKAAQGQGIGRLLMAAAAERLAEESVPRLWLTVMRDNLAARRFYAAIGGTEAEGHEHLLYGQPVFSIPVEWLDLPRLAGLRYADRPAPQNR